MITTFRCKETEKVFNMISSRKFRSFERIALRKLRMLNAATTVNDLRVPPANRLEALSGDRKGQHSIRVNDQYRVCFEFIDGDAYNFEIVDYH